MNVVEELLQSILLIYIVLFSYVHYTDLFCILNLEGSCTFSILNIDKTNGKYI